MRRVPQVVVAIQLVGDSEGEGGREMRLLGQVRFTLALAMMMVVAAASASALFAQVYRDFKPTTPAYLKVDAPILAVVSIALTAVALGAAKGHAPGQILLQLTLANLGFVALLGLAEAGWQRPLVYWFEASFALLVTGPMVARSLVKKGMERGPARHWWKGTWEAVYFAFLAQLLVVGGMILQWFFAAISGQITNF